MSCHPLLPALVAALSASSALAHPPAPTHVPYTLRGGTREIFGVFVDRAGDVNADGHADFLVYSIRHFAPDGRVRVYSGADGSKLLELAGFQNSTLQGGQPAAGAGDVDADGHDDVIVADGGASRAVVHSGADGAVLHLLPTSGGAPFDRVAVGAAGDVDGDGHDDVVVGSVSGANDWGGSVTVHSGLDGSVLFSVVGEPGDSLGGSVDGAGDLDGDGVPDVVAGAELDGNTFVNPGFPPFLPPFEDKDRAGAIRAFSGVDGTELFEVVGDGFDELLGYTVSAAGDVDGDGHGDVIGGTGITAGESQAPGFARVVSGFDGTVLFDLFDELGAHLLGVRVSGVGDVDGDGRDDLLVGSEDPPLPGGPHAQLFSGADGAVLASFAYPGGPGAFGVRVSDAGDLNADGVPDFLVAYPELVFGGGFVEVYVSQ